MNNTTATLYYVHDPMCSWCWGFHPAWDQVQLAQHGIVRLQYVLGGLATDTDQPMSDDMQNRLRGTWKRIQQEIPGIEFNYDFWSLCKPRRSTYPACRAVIAARMQQPQIEKKMILAIQQAYYLQARNPSDADVLIQLAGEAGLDTVTFAHDLGSEACMNELKRELQLTRSLHVNSFPALVLSHNAKNTEISVDYTSSDNIIRQIIKILNASS